MEKETQLDSEISIKEKFKALSPKEKYSYIWEYYKIHIIITLLSIVGLASFIHTMMTKKSTYCTITYYNSYIDENQLYSLRATLNDLLIENPEKSTILINPIWSDSNDTEGIYGIKIGSLNLLKKIDFPSKDNILTIIVNSERKEHAMDVLNVLTK